MKRYFVFLLTLTLCLGMFTACGKDEIPDGPAELWVVTELTEKYGMNDQAERMIEKFNEIYPDVTVKLDILPTDNEERAVYLNKLRTQVMGGAGPDVYLMPAQNSVPDPISLAGDHMEIEPLFWNVNLIMRNGMFYDISKFYDADETLEKEELNTSVMDGGVVDGGRYVIPLRYDFGVYLVDPENLAEAGLDDSIFQQNLHGVMQSLLDTGNSKTTKGFSVKLFEFYFSDYIDYDSVTTYLTAAEVAEYLSLYQKMSELRQLDEGYCITDAEGYVWDNSFFVSEGYPFATTFMSNAMSAVFTAKYFGEELEMYPQLSEEGTVNAIVRYYGAVGAGAEYPRLAYEFLKLFLSEEAQYETYLAKVSSTSNACTGWPVRTVNSVESRLEVHNKLLKNEYRDGRFLPARNTRMKKLIRAGITLTDEDVPAIFWDVDKVIFPLNMNWEDSLVYCINVLNGFEETDMTIEELAQRYVDNVQLYLDEG